MQKITMDELHIHISGNFLCTSLPDNYSEMSDDDLHEFILDNAWQPFENDDASYIWSNINSGAIDLKRFLESKGIEVE